MKPEWTSRSWEGSQPRKKSSCGSVGRLLGKENESVSDTVHSLEVGRTARIALQLVPEFHDVVVDAAAGHVAVFTSTNMFQQFCPTFLPDPSRARSPGMDFVSADWVPRRNLDSPWAGVVRRLLIVCNLVSSARGYRFIARLLQRFNAPSLDPMSGSLKTRVRQEDGE